MFWQGWIERKDSVFGFIALVSEAASMHMLEEMGLDCLDLPSRPDR